MPMEIEKEMEVEGSTIRSIQRSEDSVKVLDYDYKKCNGCGICVALCPVNALQLRSSSEMGIGLETRPA